MRQIWLFFVSFLLTAVPFLSQAQNIPVSAVRAPGQSWETALQNQFALSGELRLELKSDMLRDNSPTGLVVIPEWKLGLTALNEFLQFSRTIREYPNPNPGNFQRRAPWLYPIDGCYAKAAHVSAVAKEKGYVRPGKVYAYGDLEFRSPYTKNGRAFWSYHVAAGYRIGETVYVIDPTVEPSRVLTVTEWTSLISPEPSKVKIELCDANSYSPYSRCIGGKGNGSYLGQVAGVLQDEWNHLHGLGYSPVQLLGPLAP